MPFLNLAADARTAGEGTFGMNRNWDRERNCSVWAVVASMIVDARTAFPVASVAAAV